jgi:hypothetical protein
MKIPDFNNLFNLDEVNDMLDDKRDPYRKEIGDRVLIWDYSSCTHMNGMELDTEEDEQMQFNSLTYFIVIETGCKYVHDAYYRKYRQDIVVVNPLTHMRFRINSGHLRLK